MTALEKVQQKLKKSGMDSILVTSPENLRYVSGFYAEDGAALILREKAYLIVDFRYIEAAKEQIKDFEVLQLNKEPYELAASLLDEHSAMSIMLESDTMSYTKYQTVRLEFAGFEIEPARDFLEKLRQTKEEDEIDLIRRGQQLNEAALAHVLPMIKEGVTEEALAAELEYYMRKNGAKTMAFETIVLTGVNTSKPHGIPGNTRVKKGDFVLFDFGCNIDGYCSDMTRTVAFGEPTQEMKDAYAAVLKAQKTALAGIKAGMTGSECDKLARDVLEEAGLGHAFGHSLGHSVGLTIHEEPGFAPSNKEPMPAGAVVSVEPGIYLPGKFGIRIEDLVVVKEDGVENLNSSEKELIILQ